MVWLLLTSSVLGVCISMHRLETLGNFVQAEMADQVECELIVTYLLLVYLHKLCTYNCMYLVFNKLMFAQGHVVHLTMAGWF